MSELVRRIRQLDAELVKANARVKSLKELKAKTMTEIFNFMSRLHITELDGIRIEKVRPKVRAPRKPAAEKKAAAVDLCYRTGIPNPEEFLRAFTATQKVARKIVAEGAHGGAGDPESLRR